MKETANPTAKNDQVRMAREDCNARATGTSRRSREDYPRTIKNLKPRPPARAALASISVEGAIRVWNARVYVDELDIR